jgi:hypothetical protein
VARFLMVQGKGVWWSPQSRSLHWFWKDSTAPSLPLPLSLVIGLNFLL